MGGNFDLMVIQLKSVVLSKLPGLRRELTAIKKIAFQDLGEHWHRELLPEHFTVSAKSEFQHTTRNQEYIKSRMRFGVSGGNTDLVFRGKSRRFLMHGPRIKSTGTGVTIRMDAPVYFRSPKHKSPGHPDKADEVTRVSLKHRFLVSRRLESKITNLVKINLRRAGLKAI